MIEWIKMSKHCEYYYEDIKGIRRCEKRDSHPCNFNKCPLRKVSDK